LHHADERAEVVDAALLRRFALPDHGAESSKDDRGGALVVGGSRETPGGVLLAGLAALRAGAGRVQLATAQSVATALAIAFPEARVMSLSETDEGAVTAERSDRLVAAVSRIDAILIGTGAVDAEGIGDLLRAVLPAISPTTQVVLDAAAIEVLAKLPDLLEGLDGRVVIMPNPREMARLIGVDHETVRADPSRALDKAADAHRAVIALRTPETLIAAPDGSRYVDRSGHPALGTAGSGDVLAGTLVGLLARGAAPLTATLWAVHAHGDAGFRLATTRTGLGLVARELVDELPAVFRSIANDDPGEPFGSAGPLHPT
jgi:hydroxyethylthiazole kinase-like uncharacterized protein yjeF